MGRLGRPRVRGRTYVFPSSLSSAIPHTGVEKSSVGEAGIKLDFDWIGRSV